MIICSLFANPPHIGHLEYLQNAAKQEEFSRLFVIVNSDEQARQKHGYSFLDEQTRVQIIRDLEYVTSAIISISQNESVAADLEMYGKKDDIFVNSGDRDESNWNPKEVEVCERKGIQMVYLKLPKVNSSSKILDDYYKWRKAHECVTISEEAIRKYRESYRLDKLEKLEYNG